MGGIGEHHVTGVLAIMAGGRGFLPIEVAASNVSRLRSGVGVSGTVTTVAPPNTTITGGVAPYTQQWTRQSGGTPTISSAAALNPTWSEVVSDLSPSVSTWRCTVTDAVSATASTDISVTLTWVVAS